ncbi:MAG: hypothetical protein EON92_02885 [Burkholderiales bacterium]|nr:MAG: hypothetical protein EON92_02885 [Burkholderiales bacterium]
MTQLTSPLHIGIAEFAEPTLLLIGDAVAFAWLAEQVDARRDIKLAETHGVACQAAVDLHLIPATRSGRLTRLSDEFGWEISAIEAQQMAQQLRELAATTSPAHAYLDTQSNMTGVQVVASKGEYDPVKVFAA